MILVATHYISSLRIQEKDVETLMHHLALTRNPEFD
jgi:hypothetical protein